MGLGKSSVVGQVIMWAGSISSLSGEQEPVSGWLLCNGAALSKINAKYTSLQNTIGGIYGSDVNNFNVPNLQGRFLIGVSGSYPLSSTGGAATVAIDISQITSHGHSTASFSLADSGAYGHNHGSNVTAGASANHTHRCILPSKAMTQGSGGTTVTAYSATAGTLVNTATTFGATDGVNFPHGHVLTPSTVGSHAHGVTVDYHAGVVSYTPAHNNMPPYAAVHYLIRY